MNKTFSQSPQSTKILQIPIGKSASHGRCITSFQLYPGKQVFVSGKKSFVNINTDPFVLNFYEATEIFEK